ncbi:GNAT family N-acetyltransferase [Neomegalonema perideroedes]|uniref:GNAT family N-acetyltransferase n=1 Tax=Neomegalonema perideroedes TaxID=217219 RepID=UPI0003608AC3|nr:GNAT family N-acetyltransferase [Neomegalonema perideroedes]
MLAHHALSGAVRRLRPWEGRLYAEHLERLPPDARRRRFHGEVKSEALRAHASRVAKDPDRRVFGWFDEGILRGAAEISLPQGGSTAECAFAVEPQAQRRGVGSALMERAILYARNHGATRFIVLTSRENQPMLKLGRKFGFHFESDGGEMEGEITPDPFSAYSLFLEAAEEETGMLAWRGARNAAWWREAGGRFWKAWSQQTPGSGRFKRGA